MRLDPRLRGATFTLKANCMVHTHDVQTIALECVNRLRTDEERANAKKVLALKVGDELTLPGGAVWRRVS